MNHSILIIDNEPRYCSMLKAALEMDGHQVDTAGDGDEGLDRFYAGMYSVVITDLKMPKMNGMEVLEFVKKRRPETEVLLMTAYATAQTAVEAMKKGAYDYLIKPFEIDELKLKIKHVLDNQNLQTENKELKRQLKDESYSFAGIIGKSMAMQEVFGLIEKVAKSDAIVLLRGESGTGKEMVAQAIHYWSGHAEDPFVAINCAALPEHLLESELFGHEKGAFTGADKRKPGRFELAANGTILLDEIGDMPLNLQAKFLRVLQQKEFSRVGGTENLSLLARVIVATNKDLEQAVSEKRFREDLYFRINIFPIFIPPLRARRDDISLLVAYFIKKFQVEGIDHSALKYLLNYDYPGNVRELENMLERASILSDKKMIQLEHVPQFLQNRKTRTGPFELPQEGFQLDEFEKDIVKMAIDRAQGNITGAAKILGITRRRVYSLMESHGIPNPKKEDTNREEEK
jgi:DNA-binding NtrC family response regulator